MSKYISRLYLLCIWSTYWYISNHVKYQPASCSWPCLFPGQDVDGWNHGEFILRRIPAKICSYIFMHIYIHFTYTNTRNYTYVHVYVYIHLYSFIQFVDFYMYIFLFPSSHELFRLLMLSSAISPGVDAVVSGPHGGHHRNAPTEELDQQVVGGRGKPGKVLKPCGDEVVLGPLVRKTIGKP